MQNVFLEHVRQLGFADESRGLFARYVTIALRPDYYLPLGDTGLLIEVERGKTTINNMDLLDFWKCHICTHAHYLILLVPTELRHSETMSPRPAPSRDMTDVLVRMALATLAEALPGATSIDAIGEYNEDWIPTLRTQPVLARGGVVLFDGEVGHFERAVEDAVDLINSEYLDVLVDLTGDEHMGTVTVG